MHTTLQSPNRSCSPLDLLHRMAVVEVGLEEADLGRRLGILRRLPFAPLHDHGGVGNQLVAASVVEMQIAN